MDSCAPEGWRRLRVLCVDDHEDSLHVLKRLLALQRHDVRTCGTVAEARAALCVIAARRRGRRPAVRPAHL